MGMVKVEITSRTTIKPSSPTPSTLRIVSLSLIDQMTIELYVPIILYYPANDIGNAKTMRISDCLKESLSDVLVRFYPLAGRIRENLFIECNDEGVEYLEASVNCPLSQVLENPDADELDHLLPSDYHNKVLYKGVQLAVQVNHFSCRGVAIGICIYHKIVDGSTLNLFLNCWAACARGHGDSVSPKFIASSLFPPRDSPCLQYKMEHPTKRCITKRFVFDASKIASLKERVTRSSSVPQPTRFQVVAALIWKCKMELTRERLGSSTQSAAILPVDLRPRMGPPLSSDCVGNIFQPVIAQASVAEGQMELHHLLELIRDAVKKIDRDHVMMMQGDDGFQVILESSKQRRELLYQVTDRSQFTSWCSFPLYDSDFGWGRPIWISSANLFFDATILLDTIFDKGIEAWVTLDEQDMPIFEQKLKYLE